MASSPHSTLQVVLSVSELVWYFLSISFQGLSSSSLCPSFLHPLYLRAFLRLSLSPSGCLSICLSISLSQHVSFYPPVSVSAYISHSNVFTCLSSYRLSLAVSVYSSPPLAYLMVMDTDDPPVISCEISLIALSTGFVTLDSHIPM